MSRRRPTGTAEMDQLAMVMSGADAPPTRGALYRDVNVTVHRLVADGKLDPELEAATIQQARTLAAAIDRASGLAGRKQETYALAPMHRELSAILDKLAGRQGEGAGLSDLLEALATADQPQPGG